MALQGLDEDFVKEEILYREARALGRDRRRPKVGFPDLAGSGGCGFGGLGGFGSMVISWTVGFAPVEGFED